MQVGTQGSAEGGGCYFLHPKSNGWFQERELESRLWEGQRFDMSVRHITPYTPYETLSRLLPGAVFVTILREPVDRFLSLFNFRHDLKRKYKVGTHSLTHSLPVCLSARLPRLSEAARQVRASGGAVTRWLARADRKAEWCSVAS